MPLRSALFQDDPRLQRCLVSDAAHVTRGDIGDHVSRIQIALLRLGWGDFDAGELLSRTYGASTARHVLDFKRSFDIVNRSYQKTADHIVGKMTIAKLDEFIEVLNNAVKVPVPLHPHPPSPLDRGDTQPNRPLPDFLMLKPARLVRAPASIAAITAPGSVLPGLSYSLVDVIKRSNAAKMPGSLHLVPFLGAHEGPVPESDLAARLDAHPHEKGILVAMWARMAPFGIDLKINVIVDTWQGVGSKGFKCEPFDHDDTFRFMAKLTESTLGVAKFCRDAWNVHGPRDSFRECARSGAKACTSASPRPPPAAIRPAISILTSCSRGACASVAGARRSRGFTRPLAISSPLDPG